MKIGVFVPIGNNGWLISSHAPQYMPTFELNKAIVQKAEHYHFDFALSMIKLRGFGGKTEFWDHNLESFTLMAGLAAVTSRIQIYATAATLTLPPAIVARMASTIDSISGGRFGVNLVTGWQKPEYEQMGLWPGDEYFSRRYDYLTEYVQVLRDLWGTGKSDFKGDYFTMNDCRVSPQPSTPMKVICAGQSDAGMAFSAQHADFNFCFGKGVNTPAAFAPTAARMKEAAEVTGREVGSYVLFMVIADETDEAARAKWEHYKAGGPGSPNFHKSNALKTMRKQPELQGKLLAKGGWDYQLVDELVPQPGDIVLPKPRYSGFFNTPLDSLLRSRGIRHLVFTGIATNVCVESTLRDGFFLEYFGVVLSDATHQAGPEFAQQAALFNIETFFGWVSTVAEFCDAISPPSLARIA
ncbi:pyrimidine utilization protein A [Lelliottia nimipressuralis]|uniref:Pyrimidine utilization protein A n=1 Tax=Lelliottia nimipressuralis TaxID=69220 RepID=A0ABY3P5C4_9ENTR|nr:pyrimidine utilization protein A [Lelliottia nimipressuralis]